MLEVSEACVAEYHQVRYIGGDGEGALAKRAEIETRDRIAVAVDLGGANV